MLTQDFVNEIIAAETFIKAVESDSRFKEVIEELRIAIAADRAELKNSFCLKVMT